MQTRRRVLELLLLFGLSPALVAIGPGWLVLPSILAGCVICLWALLRDPKFDRRTLLLRPPRGSIRMVLLRAALGAALLSGALRLAAPHQLLPLLRESPVRWAVLAASYPILSALPQELIFRVFFPQRYSLILPGSWLPIMGVLAFAWAHIVMHNLIAVGLSAVGGLLFLRTYQQTRSLQLVALEHALWGNVLYTIGLGSYFLAG